MKTRASLKCFITIGLLCFTSFCFGQGASNGRIDLTEETNSGSYPILLSGQWEFFPNQLVHPQDLDQPLAPEIIKVPGSWNRQGYPLLGVGTYRLRAKLSGNNSGLVLYFQVINSAAKIWVNGKLMKESGVVSTDRSIYQPELTSILVPIPDFIKEADILIQVANFTYFGAGLYASPRLDQSSALFARLGRMNGIENFFAGSLMAMFIYQIILFFLFRKGKSYLWLALICLGVALRAMIVHGGSFLLPNLLPEVSWEIWKKLEFGSVYAITAFFPLYIYTLFPSVVPRKFIWFFIVMATLLCIPVIFTPQYIYGQLLEVAHVMLLLAFIYATYVIIKAWKAGLKDAKIIFYAVLASFPFILAEIMKNSIYFPVGIPFMYMVELGVLVYLLFQVYLLASHYARSYKELEAMNINLEKIVEERSGQLIAANDVKDKLLSIVSHDIKSPLNSLQGILHIYNSGAISKDEFDYYTKVIEGDLGRTTLLVDNVLNWTANQLKGIQVHLEEFNLFELIESNIQLFKTQATEKGIQIRLDDPPAYNIRSDKHILHLVLRNLLANAVKFTPKQGLISIKVERKSRMVKIEVKDNGVGIEPGILATLKNPKLVVSQLGTVNEKGTGLGLGLCHDYLDKIGGTLTIESEVGKGSTFIVVIPDEG